MKYTLTVPALPPSLNQYKRWHWRTQSDKQKEWQKMLVALLNEKGNKCPRGLGHVTIRAVLTFTVERRRDSDNFLTPMNKWSQDVLVSQGVIPDDTHEHCTFIPPVIVVGEREGTLLALEGE